MDYIAMAETLETQAASLRREAARIAQADQAELPLEGEWRDWNGDDGPPAETAGTVVDVQLRDNDTITGPANALTWSWEFNAQAHPENAGGRDIMRYRIAAEQPSSA